MIILRNKEFSFMEALKGNPKLRMSLLEYNKLKPDQNVIDEFPDLVGHDDFLKYLTWLNKNIPSKPEYIKSVSSTLLGAYPFEIMLKQANGKYPWDIQRIKDKRYVLLGTCYGNNDFVISYHPSNKEYIITQESARYMLLHRAINNLFGQKGPQFIGKYKTFKEAFEYIDKNIKTIYYSQKHDENWYKGEETDYQKKRRRGLATGIAGFGGVTGALHEGFRTWKNQNSKRNAKKLEAESADHIKGLIEELKGLGDGVNPTDSATYNKYLENATKRFMKRADKVVTKNTLKGGVKGAAKGLAIGGGLAIVANHALKKSHERGNAIRRNKITKRNDNSKK